MLRNFWHVAAMEIVSQENVRQIAVSCFFSPESVKEQRGVECALVDELLDHAAQVEVQPFLPGLHDVSLHVLQAPAWERVTLDASRIPASLSRNSAQGSCLVEACGNIYWGILETCGNIS